MADEIQRSERPVAFAVYPSELWHKEYPDQRWRTPFLWHSLKHAKESAYDTDGRIVPLYGITL